MFHSKTTLDITTSESSLKMTQLNWSICQLKINYCQVRKFEEQSRSVSSLTTHIRHNTEVNFLSKPLKKLLTKQIPSKISLVATFQESFLPEQNFQTFSRKLIHGHAHVKQTRAQSPSSFETSQRRLPSQRSTETTWKRS